MDRERLKEVHKTETTESRINEDFVDWLKNKGPTWLLVVLVGFTAYLGLVRWRASKESQHVQAWRALQEAEQSLFPASLVSVADDYPTVDAIAPIARLHAAQLLLDSVLRGRTPGTTDPDAPPMTEADREQNLNRADQLYQQVLEGDDGTLAMALHAVNAHNGRAAVAEARGDMDASRQHYAAAAARIENIYPHLAEQARSRAEAGPVATDITLPDTEDVFTPAETDDELQPARIEPSLRDLLLPLP